MNTLFRRISFIFGAAILLAMTMVSAATAQTAGKTGRTFESPDEAGSALLAAASNFDTSALGEVLGPDSYDIINTGEPNVDRQNSLDFAAAGAVKKSIVYAPKNRTRAFLEVGDDGWQFPVPIVKLGKKWYFDTRAGRQEILLRRIGRDELMAIEICRGYVEAQQEYSLTKHDGAAVNQYAQRIISSPGKHDGLAWQNPDGTWGGTVGETAAKTLERTFTGQPAPFYGYYFKVLSGQGPAARLGELNYLVDGAMIGGFALLAVPATYQVSGVKSFMVSYDGVVYEKDMGPNALDEAKTIDRFNPDRTWTVVKD